MSLCCWAPALAGGAEQVCDRTGTVRQDRAYVTGQGLCSAGSMLSTEQIQVFLWE